MTNLALAGLRIVDLTQVAAGPYATLLLGFMGAEIVKRSGTRLDIAAAQPGQAQSARLYLMGYRVSGRGRAGATCIAASTSESDPGPEHEVGRQLFCVW
jgi:crotonobetainyl-CoA:carnitine CoA-transferase CaiB-like acyl-CoA transferase